MKAEYHGADPRSTEHYSRYRRDTRTLGERVAKFLRSPESGMLFIGMAISIWVAPALADIIFLIGCLLAWYSFASPVRLPMFLPKTSHRKDPGLLDPGTDKPSKAAGISYFGNARDTGQEIWFTDAALRAHVLLFGTTGAGKTEALLSIAYNSLIQGGGFIYTDGKGDVSLAQKIMSMARRMGRADDVLIINFMTGGRDIWGENQSQLANSLNPLTFGSSSMIGELLKGLMAGDSGSGGKGDMWSGRAQTFMDSLIRVLVFLRDGGEIELSIGVIRNYTSLNNLVDLAMRDDIPENVRAGLRYYVENIPGMDQKAVQSRSFSNTVLDQHGYIIMQWTQVLNLLADDYGHIFDTTLGDVDFRDIVLNRRILVVLLPALEKSDSSLANLGRIIVASLKAMMGSTLGSEIEGATKYLIDARPTNADTPFTCILDEYGYYAVKGAAVAAAQSRSLGFSMIFAGQDYQAFQKASKEEAASTVANTSIKICMKLEDPADTLDIFAKRAGEAPETQAGGYVRTDGAISTSYFDGGNVQINHRKRIDIRDLSSLDPGEGVIIYGDQLVYTKMFYANPTKIAHMQLNTFLRVTPPEENVLRAMKEDFESLLKFIHQVHRGETSMPEPEAMEDIEILREAFQAMPEAAEPNNQAGAYSGSGGRHALELGIAALTHYEDVIRMTDNEMFGQLDDALNPGEPAEPQPATPTPPNKTGETDDGGEIAGQGDGKQGETGHEDWTDLIPTDEINRFPGAPTAESDKADDAAEASGTPDTSAAAIPDDLTDDDATVAQPVEVNPQNAGDDAFDETNAARDAMQSVLSERLLDPESLRQDIEDIEAAAHAANPEIPYHGQVSGNVDDDASKDAPASGKQPTGTATSAGTKTRDSIHQATRYPSPPTPTRSPERMLELLNHLDSHIKDI